MPVRWTCLYSSYVNLTEKLLFSSLYWKVTYGEEIRLIDATSHQLNSSLLYSNWEVTDDSLTSLTCSSTSPNPDNTLFTLSVSSCVAHLFRDFSLSSPSDSSSSSSSSVMRESNHNIIISFNHSILSYHLQYFLMISQRYL